MPTTNGTSSNRKRPTQQDVARLAGVSQATVSYVLNEHSSETVPEETQQRIYDAVEQLGYVPNATARSLRTSKTRTIAGIIPDITNPFYPALERGIQDVARQNEYDLIIYNTDGLAEQERNCLLSVQQARVDGIVAVLFHVGARELFPLLERNIAVVRVESAQKRIGEYPLDNLYVDNVAAAKSAVDYLLKQGYQRISMLSGYGGPGQTRQDGYRRALSANGREVEEDFVQVAGFSEQDGYEGMRLLLQRATPPDAVFASNDLMALGAMLALREAGLRVPEDIALIGFDDIPVARLVAPPLTTVSQFQQQMGRRAAEMLFERLNEDQTGPGRCEELPFELIIRGST